MEVNELFPEVLKYMGIGTSFWGIRDVISRAVDRSTDSDDDRARLWQIMLDAWATEQAKWLDTNRDTPTIANQVLPPSLKRNLK